MDSGEVKLYMPYDGWLRNSKFPCLVIGSLLFTATNVPVYINVRPSDSISIFFIFAKQG